MLFTAVWVVRNSRALPSSCRGSRAPATCSPLSIRGDLFKHTRRIDRSKKVGDIKHKDAPHNNYRGKGALISGGQHAPPRLPTSNCITESESTTGDARRTTGGSERSVCGILGSGKGRRRRTFSDPSIPAAPAIRRLEMRRARGEEDEEEEEAAASRRDAIASIRPTLGRCVWRAQIL